MLTNSCQRSDDIIRITSAAVSGADFVLTTDSTIVPVNGKRYLLAIPTSVLPTGALTTVYQVYVAINGQNVPLQCRIGNNVYTDQIKCFTVNNCGNIVARVIFGSTPAHFKILTQNLCPSTAYSAVAATQTTTEAADEEDNG